MATPSGQIGFDQINAELALTPTAQISMNDAAVRTLAGVPTGQISISNLQGKSNVWNGTISAPQTNLNLYTWATTSATPAYPGSGAVQVTVAPGVYVYADGATGATVYGMNIPAGFPGTVTVTNNGFIMGQGGFGENIASLNTRNLATAGQPAINLSKPVTITNNSFIAGGGGGSGAPTAVFPGGLTPGTSVIALQAGGAGGAGGGRGGNAFRSNPTTATPIPGGNGGAIGLAGGNGTYSGTANPSHNGGGGGGRILPGTGGTAGNVAVAAGGGGGGGGGAAAVSQSPTIATQKVTGGGGGWGASSGTSATFQGCRPAKPITVGAGGSAGNTGCNSTIVFTPIVTYPGQAGGRAINLNANSVTWGATGTVYGSVA
jgi:hypothetical protein